MGAFRIALKSTLRKSAMLRLHHAPFCGQWNLNPQLHLSLRLWRGGMMARFHHVRDLQRMGFEPMLLPWQGKVLPSYTIAAFMDPSGFAPETFCMPYRCATVVL